MVGILSLTLPAMGALNIRRSILAIVLVCVSGIVSDIAVQTGVGFGGALALWLWLLGISLAVLPRMSISRVFKVFAVLFVNLPLPAYFGAQLAFAMRQWTIGMTYDLMLPFWGTAEKGVTIVGNSLRFGGHELAVTPECSGVHTLYAMIAVGSILSLVERNMLRAYFLLLISPPLALLSNVIRVFVIVMGIQMGATWVEGSPHEWIGVAVFFFLSTTLAVYIRPKDPRVIPPTPVSASALPATLGTSMLLVLLVFQIPLPASGHPSSQAFDPQLPGMSREVVKITSEEKEILGTEDVTYFRFTGANPSIPVYLLRIGSGGIAHPPENCLISEGYQQEQEFELETSEPLKGWTRKIFGKEIVPVPEVSAGPQAAKKAAESKESQETADTKRTQDMLLVAYTFEDHGQRNPSYLDYRLGGWMNRTAAGTFYRVSVPYLSVKDDKQEAGKDQGLELAQAQMNAFLRDFKP